MSEPEGIDGLEIGRIEIVTYLSSDGREIDAFDARKPDGEKMDLKQILGSLTLAIDTAKLFVEDDDG